MLRNKREAFLLFLGDVLLLTLALFVSIWIRNWEVPSRELFFLNFAPFSILIAVWILVFFIAGLYEKHTLLLKSRLPATILNAELANAFLAVLFFYSIPYFKIAPKTILFIYLIVSFAFILFWRLYGLQLKTVAHREKGIIIGSGLEMEELRGEVNNNPTYNLEFISSIDLERIEGFDFQEEVVKQIYGEDVRIIAIDMKDEKVEPVLPQLYNLIFSKVRFIDMYKIYEDIFDRIPLSLVRYNWFLENISTETRITYDFLKRVMDIVLAIVVGILSLVFYPIVYVAIKFDDKGSIFYTQERIGKNNKVFKALKFRSMKDGQITRVGKWIRALRIDELPQLWNVINGDMSMIGPRPEIPTLVKHYEAEIPYYDIRHLIKPGLSGWAQLYHTDPPKGVADSDKTRRKLSYDLYYIKNRSFMLDIKIALKTVKALLSRSGV